jgi:hypothetical protein
MGRIGSFSLFLMMLRIPDLKTFHVVGDVEKSQLETVHRFGDVGEAQLENLPLRSLR